jgi:ribosomal protein S27AE
MPLQPADMSRNSQRAILALLGALVTVRGIFSLAMAEGQHWGWALLGLTLLGLLVIAELSDKTRDPGRRPLDLSKLPPDVAAQRWLCPECGADAPNTSYRCGQCGYSLV